MKSHQVRLSFSLATVVVALGLSTTASEAAVIYREVFGNNTAGNLTVANTNINWNALTAPGASPSNVTNQSATTALVGVNNSNASTPANLPNVNAGTELSQTNGTVFSFSSTKGLIYTTEYTIDPTVVTLTDVSFYSQRGTGASGGTPLHKVAAQVGSQWYVTTASIAFPSTSAFHINTFSGATLSSWNALTATVGVPFAVSGTSGPLPAGNITGFGVYYDMAPTTGNVDVTARFDTFEINATAVPEPVGVGLVAGIFGLIAMRRRRA